MKTHLKKKKKNFSSVSTLIWKHRADKQDHRFSLDDDTCNSLTYIYIFSIFIIISCFLLFVRVWGVYDHVCMRESETEEDKERESLCKEFGKLNKVPQESLPKDLGECSRFWRERPLKSENTLALSY